MTDLICRQSMTRCKTPGMCSPYGGCQPESISDGQHIDLGKFIDHVWALKAERDQLKAENEIFEEGMRSLACSLSAGGYNAVTLTADQLVRKVNDGLEMFTNSTGDLLGQITAERDQLRAEVAGLRTGYEAYEQVNAELKAEVEALRKDAERYQWLRDKSEAVHQFYLSVPLWFKGVRFRPQDVDNAIDAMSKGERP